MILLLPTLGLEAIDQVAIATGQTNTSTGIVTLQLHCQYKQSHLQYVRDMRGTGYGTVSSCIHRCIHTYTKEACSYIVTLYIIMYTCRYCRQLCMHVAVCVAVHVAMCIGACIYISTQLYYLTSHWLAGSHKIWWIIIIMCDSLHEQAYGQSAALIFVIQLIANLLQERLCDFYNMKSLQHLPF